MEYMAQIYVATGKLLSTIDIRELEQANSADSILKLAFQQAQRNEGLAPTGFNILSQLGELICAVKQLKEKVDCGSTNPSTNIDLSKIYSRLDKLEVNKDTTNIKERIQTLEGFDFKNVLHKISALEQSPLIERLNKLEAERDVAEIIQRLNKLESKNDNVLLKRIETLENQYRPRSVNTDGVDMLPACCVETNLKIKELEQNNRQGTIYTVDETTITMLKNCCESNRTNLKALDEKADSLNARLDIIEKGFTNMNNRVVNVENNLRLKVNSNDLHNIRDSVEFLKQQQNEQETKIKNACKPNRDDPQGPPSVPPSGTAIPISFLELWDRQEWIWKRLEEINSKIETAPTVEVQMGISKEEVKQEIIGEFSAIFTDMEAKANANIENVILTRGSQPIEKLAQKQFDKFNSSIEKTFERLTAEIDEKQKAINTQVNNNIKRNERKFNTSKSDSIEEFRKTLKDEVAQAMNNVNTWLNSTTEYFSDTTKKQEIDFERYKIITSSLTTKLETDVRQLNEKLNDEITNRIEVTDELETEITTIRNLVLANKQTSSYSKIDTVEMARTQTSLINTQMALRGVTNNLTRIERRVNNLKQDEPLLQRRQTEVNKNISLLDSLLSRADATIVVGTIQASSNLQAQEIVDDLNSINTSANPSIKNEALSNYFNNIIFASERLYRTVSLAEIQDMNLKNDIAEARRYLSQSSKQTILSNNLLFNGERPIQDNNSLYENMSQQKRSISDVDSVDVKEPLNKKTEIDA